jgi:hypothetical protein
MQVTVGRSPLCWWCPDSPEVNDLPGSAAAESLACPVPNLGAGTSARRNRQRHRPCHALRSAECGWTTPDDADPATEGPVLEIGVLDFDGEDPVVIHADAAVTEVLPTAESKVNPMRHTTNRSSKPPHASSSATWPANYTRPHRPQSPRTGPATACQTIGASTLHRALRRRRRPRLNRMSGAQLWLGHASAQLLWHTRVMAAEVVSHAFSQGFHPEHSQRIPAIPWWSWDGLVGRVMAPSISRHSPVSRSLTDIPVRAGIGNRGVVPPRVTHKRY